MKLTNYITSAVKVTCFVLMFIIIIICFSQVIVRYIFNKSFAWTEELAIWSLVWVVFLGSVLGVIKESHARIDYFLNLFPRKIKCIVEMFNNLVCAAMVVILVYHTLPLIMMNLYNLSPAMQLPSAIIYGSFFVGGLLMTIFFLIKMYGFGKMINEKHSENI